MANDFLPRVRIPEGLTSADLVAAQALKPVMEAAVADLKGWWPREPGQEKSVIFLAPGSSILSGTSPLDASKSRLNIWQLEFGVEALKSGAGSWLTNKAGWSPCEAISFILAHETYHLGEPARMKACGVRSAQLGSPFARGLNPLMAKAWVDAVHTLSVEYPNSLGLQPLAKKAADLVLELGADVRALNFAKAKGLRWPTVKTDLFNIRSADHQADPTNAYDIAQELQSLMSMPSFPTELEALPIIWEKALAALSGISHGKEVAEAIKTASSSLQIKPKSVFSSLFKKH
ncbi:hypothetical protein SNE35_25775 [Paucibacter sp. R3-3]|uniref:Peptidase M48 domain-containing protein n=1 Tax=Roseateles agri TaxID=3098619 RepID=A0ABU5DNQ2_9BURK|nr:hypothetical protein [Paucibacter sp. R3-3]MDY0747937.1 hypothetical protein [Paucibacter sp. R3-3]